MPNVIEGNSRTTKLLVLIYGFVVFTKTLVIRDLLVGKSDVASNI